MSGLLAGATLLALAKSTLFLLYVDFVIFFVLFQWTFAVTCSSRVHSIAPLIFSFPFPLVASVYPPSFGATITGTTDQSNVRKEEKVL